MGFSFDELSHLSVNEALALIFLDTNPSMIWGPPGIGKTEGFKHWAAKSGYRVIPVMAGCSEPTDLLGIPFPSEGNKYTDYLVTYWAYLCSEDAPDDWQVPVCIFLDDITTAHPDTQAAFHKVIYEGISGRAKIRDNVRFVAAGNRPDDKSAANEMIKSLANRFTHYYVSPKLEEFFKYAVNLHPTVKAYLKQYEGDICKFDEARESIEPAFPTPRSWEALSNSLNAIDDKMGRTWIGEENLDKYSEANRNSNWIFLKAAGCVGLGTATTFSAYIRDHLGIVPPEDIIKDPSGARLPKPHEVAKLWSTITACEHYLRNHINDFHNEPDSKKRSKKIVAERVEPMLKYALRIHHELDCPDYGYSLASEVSDVLIHKVDENTRILAFENKMVEQMMEIWGEFFLSGEEYDKAVSA